MKKFRKMQMGGEEDNKFNPTPAHLRGQASYGFTGPMQPATPNYGPMGPFNYDNSPGLKNDCPEGMIWDESVQTCTYDNGYNPAQEQEKNKPKGRGIDGMGTPKTGPGTGVNPQDPAPDKKSKVDPFFLLRGATTGLSWLSGMVERNRQNQYARDQYSTLGQLDPIPVSNFQPNPYNLYAQQGGMIERRIPIRVPKTAQEDLLPWGRPVPQRSNETREDYSKRINIWADDEWNKNYGSRVGPRPSGNMDPGFAVDVSKIGIDNGSPYFSPDPVNDPGFDVDLSKMKELYDARLKTQGVGAGSGIDPGFSIFQKGGRTPITVNNPNDPRLRAYNDSSLLYNRTKGMLDDLSAVIKNTKGDKTKGIIEWQKYTNDWYNKNEKLLDLSFNRLTRLNGKSPEPHYRWDDTIGTAVEYKKPVQPVVYQKEQKDYPIVTRPGAQVRGTITPGQMTRDTTQDGVPIYGPANSTIGYYNNGTFSPYTGVNQRGTVNNPDTELMKDPEALKKYLRGKGLSMKKGGLTPNKARQILHDKKVHGKPLTDKQRRLFGAMSKDHTLKY